MENERPERAVEARGKAGWAGREAGCQERVRRVEERPAPESVVEAIEIEEMAKDSPDGRPPGWHERRRGWLVLAAIVAFGFPVAVIAVAAVGGRAAAVVAVIIMVVMAVAAGPVWVAGIMRCEEETAIDRQVQRQAGEGPRGFKGAGRAMPAPGAAPRPDGRYPRG